MYLGNLMDFLTNLKRYIEEKYPGLYLRFEKRNEMNGPQDDKYFIVCGRHTYGGGPSGYLVVNIHHDDVEEQIIKYINKSLKLEGFK